MRVALLAGGTGGAKLAAGVQELVGPDLSVIANTADDTRIHGLYVSPDPDLVTYWLAGEIDEERGWGIRDDTFVVNERLERLGAPGWFQLSDRDLPALIQRMRQEVQELFDLGLKREFLAIGSRCHRPCLVEDSPSTLPVRRIVAARRTFRLIHYGIPLSKRCTVEERLILTCWYK